MNEPQDVIEFKITNEFIHQILINGDTLITPKEDQMLINMTGVSISTKPRKDGRYQGYIAVPDGNKLYFYGKTREDVAVKIKSYLQEGKTPKRKKQKKYSPTFGEYVEKWLKLYKEPNLKIKSIQTLTKSLKPALAAFEGKKINSITSDNVQELLLSISAPRSRDLCRMYLNSIFKKAVVQKIISSNPCDAVELKRHKAQRKKALTLEEQSLFFHYAEGTKYLLLYRFLVATGLRIGEALALHRSDIDFDKCTVTVNKNVVFIGNERLEQDTPKSEAGNRTLPLSYNICAELAKISTDILFPFTYNAIHCSIRRIAKTTGLPVSLHILRHTYATRLEEAGIPAKIKQYLLGHASLEMTENVYTDTQKNYIDSYSDMVKNLF